MALALCGACFAAPVALAQEATRIGFVNTDRMLREAAPAKDRWVIVKLKHMPHDVELKHCLRRFPDCPAKEMDLALNIVNHVRAARLDPKRMLSKAPSTRVSENIAMFLSAGVELKVALENAVTNQYSGRADDINTEAGKVAKLIEERLKNPKDGAK